MLDSLDKKILAVLDWEARMPATQIARKVRSNKDVVLNRIRKLEQKGIITQYYPVLNLNKLGYMTHRLNFEVEVLTKEEENALVAFFDKQIKAGLIFKMDNDYQYGIYIWNKSMYELEEALLKIKKHLGSKLLRYRYNLLCTISQYPKDAVFSKEAHDKVCKVVQCERVTFDEQDLTILKALAKNARTPSTELAKETRIPQQTVHYKIKNLEKKKIILGYRAEIKIQELGFEHYAVGLYLKDQSEVAKFQAWADANPHVTWFETALGGVDIDFVLEVKDRNHLGMKLDELKKRFPDIRKFDIMVERYWKLTYLPA